jgi:hypothetical protein
MPDAKRTFVLANTLKNGPFDSREAFLTSFEKCSAEVAKLSDGVVDSLIGKYPPRLLDYNRAAWRFDILDLSECCVWPHMGARPWAQGRVTNVAELFKKHEPPDSRVWDMKQFADIFSSRLPVIALKRPTGIRIDDGSHRAVAMALTGMRRVSAWIGTFS